MLLLLAPTGRDLTSTNYLLLSLALFQFPFIFWLTNVQMPASPLSYLGSHHSAAAAAGAANASAPSTK